MKWFISPFIILVLSSCSIPASYVQEKKNDIVLHINNTSIAIDSNGKQTYRSGSCLDKSFFYENEQLQIEYIRLDRSCEWKGLADGLYQDFVKNNMKDLNKTASIKIKNGDIYRFDKREEYFYLISLYDPFSHFFIIDYEGEITSKILAKELPIYSSNQIKEKLNKEFLENYQFKGYFEHERDQEIFIPDE